MAFAVALFVAAQTGVAASPSPSPLGPAPSPSPLKEIGHVRTSRLCSALNHNLFPAVNGLMLDDKLIDRGFHLMVRSLADAASEATSATITGNANAGSEMDTFQLGMLAEELARNIVKIDNLLADPERFPNDPTTSDDQELALARSRLGAVVARQRRELNILSATAEIDSANDLKSRRDIIPYEHDMSSRNTPAFTPVSMPEALEQDVNLKHATEAAVDPAILPIVAACR
jgi:hypothetical protein